MGAQTGRLVSAEAAVVELVDQSAATALARAYELRARLNALEDTALPGLDLARDQMHRLVVDIASLRNAAELLKRELQKRELDRAG
jgi:hypothetical protein